MFLSPDTPYAAAAACAIRTGDVEDLRKLLAEHTDLATAHIGDATEARSLLHMVTDWPGHFPNGPATIRALVDAGADVNCTFIGAHSETPLHWAASCDDVAVLDALLDAGADINAPGAVIGGGTPLADARAFQQLKTARRLIDRGATVGLQDAASLGLMHHLHRAFTAEPPPTKQETDWAFWNACHGSQLPAAEFLYDRGADIRVIPPWDEGAPIDVARRNGDPELVEWLVSVLVS